MRTFENGCAFCFEVCAGVAPAIVICDDTTRPEVAHLYMECNKFIHIGLHFIYKRRASLTFDSFLLNALKPVIQEKDTSKVLFTVRDCKPFTPLPDLPIFKQCRYIIQIFDTKPFKFRYAFHRRRYFFVSLFWYVKEQYSDRQRK